MKNKNIVTTICFIVAGLLVLQFFNISLGSIITFLLPFILIVCGIIGLFNGKKIIGSVLIVIGAIWGLGFLGQWLLLIVAAGLIYFGIKALSGKGRQF